MAAAAHCSDHRPRSQRAILGDPLHPIPQNIFTPPWLFGDIARQQEPAQNIGRGVDIILYCCIFGIMETLDPRIFQLHANMCKMLANPTRLMMLTLLNRNEMSVGELAERVGAPMTTVSQHLSALKERRLVTARKDKQTVYYSLTDPRILEASILIRSVLIDGMKERGELANDVSPEGYRTVDSPNQSGED